jgi:hypothetical protein
MDVEYLEDAGLGEQLEVETWGKLLGEEGSPPSGAEFSQIVRRPQGATVVRALSVYVWRRRPLVLGLAPS